MVSGALGKSRIGELGTSYGGVMVPERITVFANGLSFVALTWGRPDGPTALLLHGYPDTAYTWRHLGPVLAEHGWYAVAPFTRGYAPTDLAPNDRYAVADLVADALAVRHAVGGGRPAVLIGHDWGAVTTWAVAATAPDAFDRYVALAVPPPAAVTELFTRMRAPRAAARQARMSWYILYNQVPGAERGLGRVIPRLWRDWSPGYDAAEDLRRVFDALDGPGRRRAALRYYRNNLRPDRTGTFDAVPQRPVLYLHGDRDGGMQAEIAELAPASLPPGGRFERVAGVGHFLHLEDPDRINASILEWLGDGRPPR